MKCITYINFTLVNLRYWPDERETKDLLDFGEYHTKDDNNEYGICKLNLK